MTEQEWYTCREPRRMLDFLKGRLSDRKARLFACACLRGVDQAGSLEGVREAVEIAEGSPTTKPCQRTPTGYCRQLSRSSTRPCTSYSKAWTNSATFGRRPAVSVLSPDPWYAAWVSVAIKCRLLERSTARAREEVAKTETRQMQCALLRCIFGNPFQPLPPIEPSLLTWNGGVVLRLAQAAYENRLLPSGELDSVRLAVLADALEDAGLTDETVLSHLRQPGQVHVRGCFVIDTLLGKS